MPSIRPFRPWIPEPARAGEISCPPYDVISSAEARVYVAEHPESFMRVERAETQLPEGTSPTDPRVYEAAKRLFAEMKAKGDYVREERPAYYLYTQRMGDHLQRGLVACVPAEDYFAGRIKKHELTRKDKEQDRINHLVATRVNTGPAFLTYRSSGEIEELYDKISAQKPLVSFVADGVEHVAHRIDDPETVALITERIGKIPCSYIADGHHRSAAGALTARRCAEENPNHTGNEEYAWFVAILFPHDQLQVLGYHRWVRDLNGRTPEEFLAALRSVGDVAELPGAQAPASCRQVTMRLGQKWYGIRFNESLWKDAGPVDRLDVSLLQKNVLGPMLGIEDPRTDRRVDFIGGIRGLPELEKRVAEVPGSVAFAMHPVSTVELMDIADAGEIMPPKSTWFEPKLRSGLFLHDIDD